MGSDLEGTVRKIKETTEYFILCCSPSNEEEIRESMESLIVSLSNDEVNKRLKE